MSGPPARAIELPLRPYEAQVLSGLVTELRLLVAAPPESDDPLENWAMESAAAPVDHSDPVIARLFPRAYASEDLDAEYRRLTETGLRREKDADAAVVIQDLATYGGLAYVTIAPDHATAWLRTINAVRLAVGMRLGIATAADADALDRLQPSDDRYDSAQLYHWLGYVLETLVENLM